MMYIKKIIPIIIFVITITACSNEGNTNYSGTIIILPTIKNISTRQQFTKTGSIITPLETITFPPSDDKERLTNKPTETKHIYFHYLKMISKEFGWGLLTNYSVSTNQILAITKDEWKTWNEVNVNDKNYVEYGQKVFAFDENNVWITKDVDKWSRSFQISRTENGGQNWIIERGKLGGKIDTDLDYWPESIYFTSNSIGYIVYNLCDHMFCYYQQIYKTSNKGKDWFLLPISVFSGAGNPYCDGKLYFDKVDQGWATEDKLCNYRDGNNVKHESDFQSFIEHPEILLQYSPDGGLNWGYRTVTAPENVLSILENRNDKPGFIQQRVFGIMSYGASSLGFNVAFYVSKYSKSYKNYNSSEISTYIYFFLSFDNGKTWNIIPINTNTFGKNVITIGSNENNVEEFQFIDKNTGYYRLINENGTMAIMKTTDQGKTWTLISDNNKLFTPHYYSELSGWAWDGENNIYYSTIDGGKSWGNKVVK